MRIPAEIKSDPARVAAVREALAVEVNGLSFTYRDGMRPALSAVHLTQRHGEVIGLMGASGAGKSTLVKCLNKIIPDFEDGHFEGMVLIGGVQIATGRVCDAAPMVGMVFQDFEAQLFSTNVAHEVAFAMEQLGMQREEIRARLYPALEAVGLGGFEHRDPTSLSGGEKQRLAIASVLALRPSVIVLDEPTTDLDPQGRAEVFALVRRLKAEGISLIIVEHEAEELRECDRLVILHEGKCLADGPPARLLTQIQMLEHCGIHPPDLNRVLASLGIGTHARSVAEAEQMIGARLPSLKNAAGGLDISALESRVSLEEPNRGAAAPGKADFGKPIVEIENLTHEFAGAGRAIDDVSLKIFPGDFLAIIGQNGSGKTTLVRHIVGLLRPAAGKVSLNGRDRSALSVAETAKEVGYVFQNPDHQIFAATVSDEVAFGPRNAGFGADEVRYRCDQALAAVGLEGARDRDPFLLSKGERQRLAVASVLTMRPALLILDEPTTGLDYRETERMMNLIAELNRAATAVVIITHTPWLVASYARRVVLMKQGRKLFDGPVRELFENEALLTSASFRAPEVTALGRRLGVSALTVEELTGRLKGMA